MLALSDLLPYTGCTHALAAKCRCTVDPSNPDTLGTIPSVLFSEVSLFQRS